MNYGSVASGIECATIAFSQIEGWYPSWFSQFDPEHDYTKGPDFPSAVLQHHYPNVPNLGDMHLIKLKEHEIFNEQPIDLLVGGTPCFTADTLITTKHGVVPISEIKEGDIVLTHTGKWQRVLKTGNKKSKISILKGHGHFGIKTTPEHPFYCRKQFRIWNNEERQYVFNLDEKREWINAEKSKGYFWSIPSFAEKIPIPKIITTGFQNVGSKITPEFMWLVGLWVGDGWIRDLSRGRRNMLFCSDKKKREFVENKIKLTGLNFSSSEERTTTRYQICSAAICNWLDDNFGRGAENKYLPSWLIFCTDKELKQAFIEGYRYADGNDVIYKEQINGWHFTTISKKLSVSLKMFGASMGFSVSDRYYDRSQKEHFIQGRKVNQKPGYTIDFKFNSRTTKFDSLHAWQKIKKYTPTDEEAIVYNIEVETDNSYVADGIVVHNCTNYSVAGLRGGMATYSGNLTLEFCRILYHKKPRWFTWENVPGALSAGTNDDGSPCEGKDFACFLSGLTGRNIAPQKFAKAGVIQGEVYSVAWRILDAQYFGVPQRRRRIFIVGYFGNDWRPPFGVLFERESMRRNTKKGRKKGKGTAGTTQHNPEKDSNAEGIDLFRMQGFGDYENDGTASTMKKRDFKDTTDIVVQKSYTIKDREGGGSGGKGPLVQEEKASTLSPTDPQRVVHSIDCRNLEMNEEISGTLQAKNNGSYSPNYQNPIVYNEAQITHPDNASNPKVGDPSPTIPAGGQPHIVVDADDAKSFSSSGDGYWKEGIGPLRAREQDSHENLVVTENKYIIRRLTPVECERLQGIEDNYTNIPWNGKQTAPDSRRYAAIGNGMATPVMLWIGKRIDAMDKILKELGR